MESVVYQDSPLAAYLEGAGEADNGLNSTPQPIPPLSPLLAQPSYAPRGAPKRFSRSRRKLPGALKLELPNKGNAVARLQRQCANMLQSNLVGSKTSDFLDRFHYILIASQLLNDHACVQGYNPRLSLQNSTAKGEARKVQSPPHTTGGLLATAVAAFVVAWSIHWARSLVRAQSETWRLCLALSLLASSAVAVCLFLRRQWEVYFRGQIIEAASSLVINAQAFDAALATTVSLIQEVELISRGYRISSPLPPISRLDEQTQTRRCAHLRQIMRESLTSFLVVYAQSYASLRDFAVEVDLERYADIYEVSRSDIDEVHAFAAGGREEFGDPESLRSLKISLQRLHTIRKLYLCCLLAIRSDGTKSSLAHWTKAVDSMNQISSASASAASSLDSILSEESRFSSGPQTPSKPSSSNPGQERLRAQLRKFASLSQGTRELQAKIYLLREESDRALNDYSEDAATDIGSKLLDHYDAFGADLKNLVREWESGRAALVANIDRHERRCSLSSNGQLLFSPSSRSTTPSSLGGLTAVGSGGSPADALKILNGEMSSPLSPVDMTSSDEEVFEAIALPRQMTRSSLSREERIAKMQEERIRAQGVKEKGEAGRSMMRELETVIKLRPGGMGDSGAENRRARVTSL